MVNKLLYRSKQRGFLELDLLVGLWAEKEVPRMSLEMLKHTAAVLDQVRPAGGVLRPARARARARACSCVPPGITR